MNDKLTHTLLLFIAEQLTFLVMDNELTHENAKQIYEQLKVLAEAVKEETP